MMIVVSVLVFTGALVAAIATIAMMIAPQWRRILHLATGHVEPAFTRWRRWSWPSVGSPSGAGRQARLPLRWRAAAWPLKPGIGEHRERDARQIGQAQSGQRVPGRGDKRHTNQYDDRQRLEPHVAAEAERGPDRVATLDTISSATKATQGATI